jgi:CRP-like cAMP-binding protein
MHEEDAELAWVTAGDVVQRPLWARYVRSFDRGLLIVLGEGTHGETDIEILISTIGLLLGTSLLAYFTSRIVEILTSTNHFEQMMRQKIGRVQNYMHSAQLPAELVARCTAHLQHFMFSTALTTDTAELLRELSAPLRAEVAIASRKQLVIAMLKKSKWLESEPSAFFVKMLVQCLKPAVFSPNDHIIVLGEFGSEAYLIQSGVVRIPLPGGSELMRTAGECVGEIAMITAAPRSSSVIAVTFVEAYSLEQADFLRVCEHFPEIESRVRKLARERVAQAQQAAAERRQVLSYEGGISPSERNSPTGWAKLGKVVRSASALRLNTPSKGDSAPASGHDSLRDDRRDVPESERRGSALLRALRGRRDSRDSRDSLDSRPSDVARRRSSLLRGLRGRRHSHELDGEMGLSMAEEMSAEQLEQQASRLKTLQDSLSTDAPLKELISSRSSERRDSYNDMSERTSEWSPRGEGSDATDDAGGREPSESALEASTSGSVPDAGSGSTAYFV